MIEKFPGLVDAIKHGIIKIRESFARPCCKKILNHVQRSGVNVDMDDFKIVLDLMIVNNIITRKVTKKESFYVNDSNDIDECTVNNDEDDGGHFNNSNISEDVTKSFHETLLNNVQTQIKSQFNELSHNLTN